MSPPLSNADIAIQNRGGCRADIKEVRRESAILSKHFSLSLATTSLYHAEFLFHRLALKMAILLSRVIMHTLSYHSQIPCTISI